MKIVDIVNRESVNLTNCESEPIHIPGSIQPHGFLMAVQPGNNTIVFCSNNVGNYLNLTPQQILLQPLNTFFDAGEINCLYNRPQNTSDAEVTHPCVFTYAGIRYNTMVHNSGELLVLEFEPFPDGSLALPDLYIQTRKFVSFLDKSSTLQQLCNGIAEETRRITGYDRVMIYRFDKDYNGEVFAESKREDLQPFLGLNYPHTDIPAQARQLYLHNLMRMITDVHYTPVPLLTVENAVTDKTLDLSHSVLRSVSPIHIEYLKNMGVGATLTISLIQDKKLWGLIACHHYAPKNLPHYTRLSALLQGHFLTSQIRVREVADEHALGEKIDLQLQQLLDLFSASADNNMATGFTSPLLRHIANADGVAVMHNGTLYNNGQVPQPQAIEQLAGVLKNHTRNGVFYTTRLSNVFEQAQSVSDVAAGVIFHQLGNNDYIIWFRQEVVKSIHWAGDPAKAVVTDNSLKGLSPRTSFELWKQVVKLQSPEWHHAELNAAGNFAFFLQRQFSMMQAEKEELKYRQLSEQLQAANEELANINWISTHDLKEPLRKIQIFASRILEQQEAQLPATIQDYVTRMRLSASRMQVLIDDLMAYSRISNNENSFEQVNLEAEIHNITEILAEEIQEAGVVVTTHNLPVLQAIPFQIKQLFLNLISNAVKFSHHTPGATISIQATQINNHPLAQGLPMHKIQVVDNGIGFDNMHKHRIFEVFQRLHGTGTYTGTGIGLAICKKVADNHHGFIEAEGQDGKGATFTVYLPVQLPLLPNM
jgi:light-regulated signal transduction histidine kinase (bacteriophytochrome)